MNPSQVSQRILERVEMLSIRWTDSSEHQLTIIFAVHGRGLLKPRCSDHSDPPYPYSSSFFVGPTGTGTGLDPIGTGTGIGPTSTGTGTGSFDPTGTNPFPTGASVGPVGTDPASTSALNTTTSFVPPYYSYSLLLPTGVTSTISLGPIGTDPGASGTGFPVSSTTSGAPYANTTTSLGGGPTDPVGPTGIVTSVGAVGTGTIPISTGTFPIIPIPTVTGPISPIGTAPTSTATGPLDPNATTTSSNLSGFTTIVPLPTGTTVSVPTGLSTTSGGIVVPTGYYYHHGKKGHHHRHHYVSFLIRDVSGARVLTYSMQNWWDIINWFTQFEEEHGGSGDDNNNGGDDGGYGGYGYSKI